MTDDRNLMTEQKYQKNRLISPQKGKNHRTMNY